jgi:hypothetical protein
MARKPPNRYPMHENMPDVDWRRVLGQAILGALVLFALLGAYTSFYTV